MSTATQKNREAAVTTELGDDVLLFCSLRGREELARPFEFELSLVSTNAGITAKEMLGTEMSVTLNAAAGGTREFNGVVSRFTITDHGPHGVKEGFTRYEAVVRPRLWLLTRASHCRFFYKRTVRQIVMQLLGEYNLDCDDKCEGSDPELEHCAQYRETDFDFLSRLLEREGIYYYFEHKDRKDRLVLANSPKAHSSIPKYESIAFQLWTSEGYPRVESVYRWQFHEEVAAGTSEINSFDFKNVKLSENQGLLSRATPGDGNSAYVLADYAMRYDKESDGRRYAQARIEEHQAHAVNASGRSTARGVWPGGLFKLTGYPRSDQNGEYLVTAATYSLESDDFQPTRQAGQRPRTTFECTFSALPTSKPYRAQRLTPRPHAGLQTALVVAPGKDEIATDAHGQVKVQFHWEQFNPPAASERMQRCWVRVAQNWAGRNWGAIFLPRAGQEVVVAFLDGDVDHPLVVGCVYNSTNQPPYALPGNEAVSTIRTKSIGEDNERNELRFNDKDLQLLLYTGGRYDSYVKKNGLTWIGEDEHAIVEGRQLVKVGADQHLTVSGSQNVKVGSTASFDAGANIIQRAGANYLLNGQIVHVKGGMNVVIEAGVMLTLKAADSFVTIGPTGVQISGPLVGLNSGGAAGSAQSASPAKPDEPKKADDGSSLK